MEGCRQGRVTWGGDREWEGGVRKGTGNGGEEWRGGMMRRDIAYRLIGRRGVPPRGRLFKYKIKKQLPFLANNRSPHFHLTD